MSANGEAHLSGDRLLDIVQGLLSGPELAGALRHLKSCPACEERFREVGREFQILMMRASPALPAIERERVLRRRWVWAAVAATAAVLVVVASWPLFRNATHERDGCDYWLPVEDEKVLLRSAPKGAEDGSLLEAVEAYGRHDTARVVDLLMNRDLSNQQRWLRVFLASALVWQGRNTEARDLLNRMQIWLLPQPYRDRARWILYVAEKRAGDDAAADEIARDLTSRPGEFAERARRALAQEPSTASP